MNLQQYILLLISEESGEIAKAASKAIRFGLNEHHPEDPLRLTNKERIANEFIDLIATLFITNILGIEICPTLIENALHSEHKDKIIAKIHHIVKFMKASIYEGQLNVPLVDIRKIDNKIQDTLNNLV